jgi:nucleoside-diphosphate-sugar epimerase
MDGSPARVAVTGAAGFIGGAVCRALRAEGREVVGIDLSGADVVADVTDAPALAAALDGCDGVVHTAAIVEEGGAMADYVRVNTQGTRNVLDAIGPGRAVCLTSVAVWGYDFRSDMDEAGLPRPCGNPYIDTKGASETLALLRGATVVRPGDVHGPGSKPWILRPLEAMRSGRFVLPGRGDGVMTPVYVDDLADAIVRALDAPGAAGRAYTVWDGEPVPAREFFSYHARWAQTKLRTAPRPLAALGAALTPGVHPDALRFVSRRAAYPNTRAREELGWEPRVSLAEGMARSEAWLRDQGLL